MHIIRCYPKLLLFVCAIALAYLLYHFGQLHWVASHLNGFGYPSLFMSGLLYSFGFTAPFATAYFVEIAPDVSPIPAALIGGLGAAIGNFCTFQFVSFSLREEFGRLRATPALLRTRTLLKSCTVPSHLRSVCRYVIAGIFIASPLPDEIGVSMLAGFTDIDSKIVTCFCLVLSTSGILTILLLAH